MKQAVCIPVFHPQSHTQGREILTTIREELLEKDVVLVGQNIKFDLARLARSSGGPVAFKCLCKDSMLYHYMMDEHGINRSLDYLSRRYTKYGGYKETVKHSQLANTDINIVGQYNATDAALPVIIIEQLTKELKEQGYWSDCMEQYYMRLVPFVACMETVGIHIDKKALESQEIELTQLLANYGTLLKEMAPDVNIDSPKQLSSYLYEELGLEIPNVDGAYTETGMPSTKESVLEHLHHPYPETLVKYRKTAKKMRTYIEGIKAALRPDGNVYPEYFLAKTDRGGGTVTGRLSCKKPAMQTIPKGSDLRSLFISRYHNGLLIDMDASQMELRYAAFISRDKTMLKAFREKKDLHQITADACGVDRKTAKTINFGIIYGITVQGLVNKAGLSEKVAQSVYRRLRKTYPGLFDYLDQTKEEILTRGEIATPYGRWRRLPGATMTTPKGRYLVREGVNFTIQAPASDITQLLGWLTMRALDGTAWPIMSVHDELVYDVREENLNDAVKLIERAVKILPEMISGVFQLDFDVPLLYDVQVGRNWNQTYPLTTISTEEE